MYKKNHKNSLTRGSVEQLNAENIHPCAKDATFSSMCDFPEKYIKLPKCSCVLNCCSECCSVVVTDV